jgi:hypothetical protein
MMTGARTLRFTALVACFLFLACSKVKSGGGGPDAGPIPSGAGVGEACGSAGSCRGDLSCDTASKTCMAVPTVIPGGACRLSAECIVGNYCTQQGACAPSGKGVAGAGCSSEGDCVSGLVCAQTGLTGVCHAAGTVDLGRGCAQTTDCLAGLLCVSGVCTQAALSPWGGVVCNDSEDTIPKIDFHVPRASDPATDTDFYKLPFPNDIRIKNGKVNLRGYPRPGPRILPFDLVDRYITAIEAESTGFSANPTMILRFSKAFNASAFPGDCGLSLVDITPTSPYYTLTSGLACGASNGGSRYVCGPYMWARTPLGSPLRPGTTYALLIRKTITDLLGNPFGADSDFSTMLDAAPPTDPDLAAAYAAYLPLRNYIATGHIAASDLAAALVFTVEKYEDPLAGIDAAIASAAPPAIGGMVRCGDPGAVSPCDDGKTGADHVRGCLAGDSTSTHFDTYQGTIDLPVFQQGTPPYLAPANATQPFGGSIAYDPTGVAIIQTPIPPQHVCFALTVPKGVPPASGWPLVVYSHGTGGSYHSIIDLGLSEDYALGKAPVGLGFGVDGGTGAVDAAFAGSGLGVDGGASAVEGASVPMAVFGYDGILHGTRNGGSTTAVGELVYNFLNPVAARDNALQAAADLLSIPHGLAGFTAQGIPLDGKRLALYGHSQGGNAASLVAARQSSYGTIVMSGTGGEIIYTLLGKTQPVNIPAVLPYLLGENGPAAVDATHPVLGLMQMFFERSDSVNFARRPFREPLPTMTRHHILHVYGTKDSYSVVPTQQAYALAAGFQVAPVPPIDNFGLPTIASPPPVSDNEFFGSFGKLTALEIQYQPDATYDGHFVSTQNPSARAAIQEMLVTAARDGIPTVSP